MRRKIAITLMSVGVIFIGLAMGLLIYNNYENRKAQENSDALMESIRLSIVEVESEEVVTDPFEEEMKIKEINGYGYIGY